MVVVLPFFDLQKGSVTATRISEQSTLLTKVRLIVCVINFSGILAKNGQSNLVFVLVLILESKAL